MQPFEKMPFNEMIVDVLEKLTARAKEGKMNFLAFSLCEGATYNEDGFLGDTSCFHSAHYGLMHCARRMMDNLDLIVPKENLAPPANLYAYDMSTDPSCHDFIPWMITSMMMQAREGVEGPTKLCFIRLSAEAEKNMGSAISAATREEFHRSVMVPATVLFDIEVTPEAKGGRRHAGYTYDKIVTWFREGTPVPRIKVPEALMEDMRSVLNGDEPVTITLREHRHFTHRNSSLTDWLKFAEYLQDRGERVIILRDYAKADEDIVGFDTMPAASRDFSVRAALYESSKCNLFVSNGPSTLGLFGSRPWLQFIHCEEDERYPQNTPEWWWLNHGIHKGEQFPWSGPNQRIVWEADTFDAMVRAWEEMFPAKVAKVA